MTQERIRISIPYVHSIEPEVKTAMVHSLYSDIEDVVIDLRERSNTSLPHNFNTLFCDAVNEGFDWWLLNHDDVAPVEKGWLGVMLAEAKAADAPVLTANNAIKDWRKLSSTCVANMHQMYEAPRRLTAHELKTLPSIFDLETVMKKLPGPWPKNPCLAPNTGCMLIRLRKDGKELPICDFPGFEFQTRIEKMDGKRVAIFAPEDWLFGRWCGRQGIKVYCTRLVTTLHFGRCFFASEDDYGGQETDELWHRNNPCASKNTSKPMPEAVASV